MAAYSLNPVFDNIMKQKKLDSNVFSFYFDRSESSRESRFILGGIDEDLFKGKINYNKVVDQYYWTILADKILIAGKDSGLCDSCKVVADTGTSLITGPTNKLNKLLSHFIFFVFLLNFCFRSITNRRKLFEQTRFTYYNVFF